MTPRRLDLPLPSGRRAVPRLLETDDSVPIRRPRGSRETWVATAADAIGYLLRIQHWPAAAAADLQAWADMVRRRRRELLELRLSPEQRGELGELLDEAWELGRRIVTFDLGTADWQREGGSPGLPKYWIEVWEAAVPSERPWSLEEIANPGGRGVR